MLFSLDEIKEFAEENWNRPEKEQVSVPVEDINLTNPWVDRSARFPLSNTEAVKEWGLAAVLEFCVKAEKKMLEEIGQDTLCGFVWKHGNKDYSIHRVDIDKMDQFRIIKILNKYKNTGNSFRNVLDEKLSSIFD